MNLLFDLEATQPSGDVKRHGGGKYGEAVFRRMIERKINFACFFDARKWLNPEIETLIKDNNIQLFDIANQRVEEIIRKNNFDRLYSCLPRDLAKLSCCDVYGTVHGLRTYETPNDRIFWGYRKGIKSKVGYIGRKVFRKHYINSLHKRDKERYFGNRFHMVTVSEHSMNAWKIYFHDCDTDGIKCFYSPYTGPKEPVKRIENGEKYFLSVSGRVWSKNILRAVIAFDRLVSYGLISDMKMKITGTTAEDFKYMVQNPKHFDFLDYVDDDVMENLYANANALVYPSLNEGFGDPPIDAMRYGVPVIASSYSAISEICGSGALYFNPLQIEEIMNRMLMITEKRWYLEYSEKALNQYKRIRTRQDSDLEKLIDYITDDLR